MRIQDRAAGSIRSDLELIEACLPLRPGDRLLELGCGQAQTTRALAAAHPRVSIVAMEVDRIQHEKNLQGEALPNVSFQLGGAQDIALEDASMHAVVMLKSLHHVPPEAMDRGLEEIRRVLVPGGLAYVAEPIFAGPFNDILRLFHDEESVRRAAFDALGRAVTTGGFELVREIFYGQRSRFEGWAAFEADVLGVTHTHFDLDTETRARVRRAFEARADDRGVLDVVTPQRVDLLRRVG